MMLVKEIRGFRAGASSEALARLRRAQRRCWPPASRARAQRTHQPGGELHLAHGGGMNPQRRTVDRTAEPEALGQLPGRAALAHGQEGRMYGRGKINDQQVEKIHYADRAGCGAAR